MQTMYSAVSSPKRRWNLLVDELHKGLEATHREENEENQSFPSPITPSHSSPSYVIPPPIGDVTMGRVGWGEKGEYRVDVGYTEQGDCAVTSEERGFMTNTREKNLNHTLPNGNAGSNFLLLPTSQVTKVTSQCPLRKVELQPRKFYPQLHHTRSLNDVNFARENFDSSRHSKSSYGACNHQMSLADRRHYVRESLAASPHTVRDVVDVTRKGGGKRRRKKRTASSRIRRKTQLHGRSAAYRIARRNAIRSRRRKNEIISTKRTLYEPKPTFSTDLVTDNFFLSLFALLCFLPLGVASMCYTFAVKRYLAENDRENALLSSLKARKLADTGVMLGITGLATAIVVLVVKANIPYAAVEYDYYLPEY